MEAVVVIGNGCDLRIKVHYRYQPNNTKVALYKPLFSL